MRNFKFVELTDEQYTSFVGGKSQQHFMQTLKMRDYYNYKGIPTFLIGALNQDDEIVAGALVCQSENHKGNKKFDIYKGFVMDYDDGELLKFMVEQTATFLKQRGGVVFTIDPNIDEIERNIDGDIVENGKNNKQVVEQLLNLGFIKSKIDPQQKWIFALDLQGKTIDEIFAGCKQNTRNIIKRTQNKFKLEVRSLDVNKDEFKDFLDIEDATAKRRGFFSKPWSYYKNMKKAFGDDVKFEVAYLNSSAYMQVLEDEKSAYEQKVAKTNAPKKKENYLKEIGFLNKKIEDLRNLQEKEGDVIPLSCAMFVMTGEEIVYLFSGSLDEHMQYYGQYILQWKIIEYAVQHGYERYNFFGISDITKMDSDQNGVYEFKKGFGGCVHEMLGEYYYVIDEKAYKQMQNSDKLKRIIKKILKK